jgi:hypothetical protein
MIIKPGVAMYENRRKIGSTWTVYVTDPVDRQKRKTTFATLEEARAYAMRAHGVLVVERAKRSIVGDALGQRQPYAAAVDRYCDWLRQSSRASEYIYIVRNLLLSLPEHHPIEFCDQVSYDVLRAEHARRQHRADHGRKALSTITTFLNRIKKKWRIAIDETAVTYGRDGEIAPPDAPTRVGSFTDAEVGAILSELHMLAHSETFTTRARDRWRALFAICFFLLRYGMRPKHASNIKVGYWNTTTRQLMLPVPARANKQMPRMIHVDRVTARLLDWSAKGKAASAYLFSPPLGLKALEFPQWTTGNLARFVKMVLHSLGIEGNLYRMKHTALTYLCRRHGGDLKLVAEVSGHRQVKSLWRYLQIPPDRRQVIAEDYDKVDASQGTVELYEGMLGVPDDQAGPAQPDVAAEPSAPLEALSATTAAPDEDDENEAACPAA